MWYQITNKTITLNILPSEHYMICHSEIFVCGMCVSSEYITYICIHSIKHKKSTEGPLSHW